MTGGCSARGAAAGGREGERAAPSAEPAGKQEAEAAPQSPWCAVRGADMRTRVWEALLELPLLPLLA